MRRWTGSRSCRRGRPTACSDSTSRSPRFPRSISVIESDHITRYDVRTVNDLVTVAPGSFTGSYFGVPGQSVRPRRTGRQLLPRLSARREPRQLRHPGRRDRSHRDRQGPALADLRRRQDRRLPELPAEDGSHRQRQVDGAPAGKSHARRTAATTRRSRAPRSACRSRSAAVAPASTRSVSSKIQTATTTASTASPSSARSPSTWSCRSRWRMEFGAQGYSGQRPQNIGWNRVTQDLVDKKQYLAGVPAVNLSSNGTDLAVDDLRERRPGAVRLHDATWGPCLRSPRPSRSRRACSSSIPSTLRTVTLSHDQIFVDGADFSDAFTMTAYFDVVNQVRPRPDVQESDVLRRDGPHEIQHLRLRRRLPSVGDREQDQRGLGGQPVGVRRSAEHVGVVLPLLGRLRGRIAWPRISGDRSPGRRQSARTPNDRFQGPFNSNGEVTFNYFQEGSYGDTGLFLLSNLDYKKKLNILGGVRLDYYTPDFTGRFNGEPVSQSTSSDTATTYNVSVTYSPGQGLFPYFTYATSTYLELGQGQRTRPGDGGQRHLPAGFESL